VKVTKINYKYRLKKSILLTFNVGLKKMNRMKLIATLLIGAFLVSSFAVANAGATSTILEEYNSVRSLVLSLNLPKGAETSILAKLDASKKSYLKGNYVAAMNQLVALKNYLNAQKGKKVPEEAADQLLARDKNLWERIRLGSIQEIKIGVTYNHNYFGAQTLADIARTDINTWLEANGKPYRVDFYLLDNQGSDQVAMANTQQFHEQGIDIIVGHPYSSQCEASLEYVNNNGMLLLSSSSTSPSLEIPGDNLLRGCPSDRVQVQRILDFYEAKHIEAIVLLYVDDSYGQWMRGLFEELSPERVEIIASISYTGDVDSAKLMELDEYLSSYLSQNPVDLDAVAVHMIDYGEIADSVEALEVGEYQYVDKVVWFGNEATAISDETLYRIGEQAVKHRIYRVNARPDEDSPLYQSVAARYMQITGSDLSYYQAVTYDLYWIIARAIIQAQSLDPMNVKAAIIDLYGESSLPQPMTSLTLALARVMQGITEPYEGISGDVGFNEDGDRPDADYNLIGYAWVDKQLAYTSFGTYEASTGTIQTLEVQEQPPEFVTIGITSATTSAVSIAEAVAQLAKTDINQDMVARGIGMWFDFVVLDNEGSSVKALENTQILHDLGINLIIGHGWSSQCSASLDYVNKNEMLLFSASSTTTNLAMGDNLYRLTPNEYVRARIMARLYQELGKKAVVIYYRDGVGNNLGEALIEECGVLGVEVLGCVPYDPGSWMLANDLGYIEALIANSPYSVEEVAFELLSFFDEEVIAVLREAKEGLYPSLQGVEWFGSESTAKMQRVLDEEPLFASQVRLYSLPSAPDYDNPRYVAFNEEYGSITGGEADFYAAAQYDIFWILAESVISGGGVDTSTVKAEIEALVQGYPGVSGLCSLDGNGDRIASNYDVWGYGIVEGEPTFVLLGEYDLATDAITLFPVSNFGVINVRVEDWYAVVKDPSYEEELQGVVLPRGEFYSDIEMYRIYFDWRYLASQTVAVEDRLKPSLILDTTVTPESYGYQSLTSNYDPETGALIISFTVTDPEEGVLDLRYRVTEPLPEPSLFTENPQSTPIVLEPDYSFTHTLDLGTLITTDDAYAVTTELRLLIAEDVGMNLLDVQPSPGSTSTSGNEWTAFWWSVVDPSTMEGSYPIGSLEKVEAAFDLESSTDLVFIDSMFIRYVGDGDDIPCHVRYGEPVQIYLSDSDVIRGWEGIWPYQPLKGNVRSMFNINMYQGPDLMLYDTQVWSHTSYWEPKPEDTRIELALKTGASSVDGPEDIVSVTVTCPDGRVVELSDSEWIWGEPPGDAYYFMVIELEEPLPGTYTFIVEDAEGNSNSRDYYYDGFESTPFTSITPSYRSRYDTSDTLSFSWSTEMTDVRGFSVHLWNEDNGVDWQQQTLDNHVDYTGDPLPEGRYEFAIEAWNNRDEKIYAYSEFWVGPDPMIGDFRIQSGTHYWPDDPSRDVEYELRLEAWIYSTNYDEVDEVKVIYQGEEYRLWRDWDEASNPWDMGRYVEHVRFDNPVTGDFYLEVTTPTTTITDSLFFDDWLITPFDYVLPATGSYFPDYESLVFSWHHRTEDIERYVVHMWRDRDGEGQDVWEAETTEESLTYSGDPLEPGKYYYQVRAEDTGSSKVIANSYVFVGDPFQFYDTEIWSWTAYSLYDLSEPNEYEIGFKTGVFSDTGLQDIEYVQVVDPLGNVHILTDSEPIWDEPIGDGVYLSPVKMDSPLSGTYIFEAKHSIYGVITREYYYDAWVSERFTYISPGYREHVTTPFTISWETPLTEYTHFRVEIQGDENGYHIWIETQDKSVVIDELPDGLYELRVIAWNGRGGEIAVGSELWVGPDPLFTNFAVNSITRYFLEDPAQTMHHKLRCQVYALASNYDDIMAISVEFPDGSSYELERDWDEYSNPWDVGRYQVTVDTDQFNNWEVIGWFTFTVVHTGGTETSSVYFDKWLTTPYDYVAPDPGSSFESSDGLEFTWQISDPEVNEFIVSIWTHNEGIWDDSTTGNSLPYTGEPLDDGLYYFDVRGRPLHSDEANLRAQGYFYIGELGFTEAEVKGYKWYNIEDPENTMEYHVQFYANVWSCLGVEGITNIIVTLPDQETEVVLYDDMWGDPIHDGSYHNYIQVEEPIVGDFPFTVTDVNGLTAQRVVPYDGWVEELFDYISPGYREIVPSSDDLVFDWSVQLSDINDYVIQLYHSSEDIWWTSVSGPPVQYDGPWLEPGRYTYHVQARAQEDRGEVIARTEFIIGPYIQLYNPSVRTNIVYNTGNEEDLCYRLILSVNAFDLSGANGITSVTVTLPDDQIVQLFDEFYGWGEHPAGDGEYFNVIEVLEPLVGTYTFTVSSQADSTSVSTEHYTWLPIFSYTSPSEGSVLSTLGPYVFEWATPMAPSDIESYSLSLGYRGQEHPGFYEVTTSDTTYTYDDPLPEGEYWWFIIVNDHDGNSVHAATNFSTAP